MTITEKEKILNNEFNVLWKQLWGNNISIQYRGEEKISREKFNKIKNGLVINNNKVTIRDIINNSRTFWVEPEWGFPKGHMTRNELYKKEYFKCAKRELFEETGIDLRTLQHTKYGSVIIGNKLFFVIEVKKEFIETNPLDVYEIEKIQWVKRKELNRFVQANECNVTLNKLF